jgi:hypothetical protein
MPKKIKGEKNFGEKAEIACQKWLLSASHEELVNVFGDVASEGIQLLHVDTHKVIQCETDVKKTASGYKADTCIEFIKTGKKIFPSIKSNDGAAPTFLNTTPRSAKVFKEGGYLHPELGDIDTLASEYIKRREAGEGEDIRLDSFECYNDPFIHKTIDYFTFKGTGQKGVSKQPADSILYFTDGKITSFKMLETDKSKMEYINNIIHRIKLSFRSKGMPKKRNKYNEPWCNWCDDKEKGAINMRVVKN